MKRWRRVTKSTSILLIVVCLLGPHVYAICDFDDDGVCDLQDIDLLTLEIEDETHDSNFDLTGDGLVDERDRAEWLGLAATENGFVDAYPYGDSNLDGSVNALDLMMLGLNWQSSGNVWSGANFWHGHDNGAVNAQDLNALALNWQKSVAQAPATVPEPAGLTMLCVMALVGVLVVTAKARR